MNTKSIGKSGMQGFFSGGKWVRRVFDFLASLQLAVGTLIALMVVLAAGTIIESRFGADAARLLIYGTAWFGFILVVLVLNLACSAADRLPWKKKHVGFVLTHLGIIIILAGSLATQQSAVDGQMVLEEGSSGKWVSLKQPMLYVYSQTLKEESMLPFQEHAFSWKGHKQIAALKAGETPVKVAVTQFLPKAQAESKWAAFPGGPAALQVTLYNSFMNVTQWIADEMGGSEIQMGPATMKFAHELIEPDSAASTEPFLEIQYEDKKLKIPAPSKKALPFEQVFDGGLRVKVLELYDYAYVEENILKEGIEGAQAENPAAVLEIQISDKTEKHTVFANFPDFPTVHGRPASELGIKANYRHPHEQPKGEGNELRFISQPDGVYYQIKTGTKLEKGRVAEGKEVATGWMDLKFRVDQVLPHAAPDMAVTALPADDRSESVSAAEIEFQSDNETKKFWAVEGIRKSFVFGDEIFEVIFSRKQLPLGFEMALKDFRVKNDPGTDRPAAFESDVVVKDFSRGTSLEKTISMNQPLVYRGFKIYQAGYAPNPGGPETSVFAVGRDPGIPIKYAGAIIMVIGTLLMFYTRAYSLRNERGLK